MPNPLAATFMAAAALACPAGVSSAATVDVFVYSFEFSVNPPGQPIVDAVITVGDTVRWVWVEGNHTTTSVIGIPEMWNADIDQNAPTFEHTFTSIGTWEYYCQPHGFDNGDGTAGGMAGTVTVLPNGLGACCLVDGSCILTSPAECSSLGGSYAGDDSTCDPNPCANQPVTMTVLAQKDSILYETAGSAVSNGAGRYLYTGNQNNGLRRRSVIRFDLAAIPAGATVQSAALMLYCSQSQGAAVDVTLSRLLADWGEGASNDNGDESDGAPATVGDATWPHRFFDTLFWASPGGDFAPDASASVAVAGANAFYAWGGSGLAADVQGWINGSASNFGWIVRGNETSSADTKRFDSREAVDPSHVPVLQVIYLPPGAPGACCLSDGSCAELAPGECAALGGTFQGENTMCSMVSCPLALTPFIDPLPLPAVAQPLTGVPGGAAHYEIAMTEFTQQLHSELPPTRVWGYGGSYPGATIEARRDEPVTVTWVNDLRELETGTLRTTHVLPVDTCLHGPDVTGEVPVAVVHLHGGRVAPENDGDPELAFPPGAQSPIYTYPNDQPPSTIWYHDHALGITRLNVMMGLAGFYLIRDDAEDALGLPAGEYEIPMAIQDRSFNTDGSLQYHEMWHDHFFGEFLLVNGKVWPYLEVKRGKYRFRIVDGSNSRVYTLALSNGATFWQIGTDLGLLDAPVPLTQLTIAPGERADLVFDFEQYAPGTELLLVNSAPAPYPGPPGAGVIPHVMKFVVTGELGHTAALPATLAPVIPIPPEAAVLERTFDLSLMADTMCPENDEGMWTINGLEWDDVTEFPQLGTAEIWAWANSSSHVHPMHMHLVAVQIVSRQPFDPVTGEPTGEPVPPLANEAGWKDTVQAPPGQITRVITRFDGFEGLYPYHCHLLEHEDHEMMRQFEVLAACPSDLNGDMIVDGAELGLLLGQWGGPGSADLNGSGTVDGADLGLLLGDWGACG